MSNVEDCLQKTELIANFFGITMHILYWTFLEFIDIWPILDPLILYMLYLRTIRVYEVFRHSVLYPLEMKILLPDYIKLYKILRPASVGSFGIASGTSVVTSFGIAGLALAALFFKAPVCSPLVPTG